MWFWLVVICSIAATRLVSVQLSDKMIQLPSHESDIRQLNGLSSKIARNKPNDLMTIVARFSRQQQRRTPPYELWIKNLETHQLTNTRLDQNKEIAQFISGNSISEQATWQFQKFRITGPIAVTVGEDKLQLFVSRPTKNPRHLSMAFMRLPMWARISIPLVVSFLLCWWLARTLSRPISNIAEVATQFGEGNLSVRVANEAQRADELGHLARSFNAMAVKLEQSMSSQQRLLGDVSHELRSPLTRLQMALGLVQTNIDKPEAQQGYLARCELEVSRLDEMIGNVLALSRLENTLQQTQFEQCDLANMFEMLIEDAKFFTQDKSVTINYDSTQSVIVIVDSQLIASAFGNILNNAVKYTPENSVVDIKVEHSNKKVTVVISDNGVGVPQDALPHLFEPFYRVAEARDRRSGGTGLGLAIAKQAIELHGGNISAKNKDDGGLQVTVELPQQ